MKQITISRRRHTHHLLAVRVLSSLQFPPCTALFKAQGDIECCFLPASATTLFGNSFFGLPPIARKYLPRWLQSRLDTSVGDIVEFHPLVVPMGWNWAVWFVQQMLEDLLPDEAGETALGHLSPTPLWDDSLVV